MVASTIEGEAALDHPDDEAAEEDVRMEPRGDAARFLHPWASEMYRRGLSFNGNERDKLFLGLGGGHFDDASDLCGADSPLDGRALIACDFDDDGDVDLFCHNIQRGRHRLYRNDIGAANGFVKVRLRATEGQHEAIGATVTVVTARNSCTQVLSRGSGFASCMPPELVFGLGGAPEASVSVRWPGGILEEFGSVPRDSRVLLVEGIGRPAPVEARPAPLADPYPTGLKLAFGEKVPELVLLDASGERLVLDLEREVPEGGRLFLTFWASYCEPCVRELPVLEDLQLRADSAVIAISVDVEADRGMATRLLAQRAPALTGHFISPSEEDNEGRLDDVVDLWALAVPTTLVIGDQGRLQTVLRRAIEAE